MLARGTGVAFGARPTELRETANVAMQRALRCGAYLFVVLRLLRKTPVNFPLDACVLLACATVSEDLYRILTLLLSGAVHSAALPGVTLKAAP